MRQVLDLSDECRAVSEWLAQARDVLERLKSEEVKVALRKNTDEAFGNGAFGLPWFHGEWCFFSCCYFWEEGRKEKICWAWTD